MLRTKIDSEVSYNQALIVVVPVEVRVVLGNSSCEDLQHPSVCEMYHTQLPDLRFGTMCMVWLRLSPAAPEVRGQQQ